MSQTQDDRSPITGTAAGGFGAYLTVCALIGFACFPAVGQCGAGINLAVMALFFPFTLGLVGAGAALTVVAARTRRVGSFGGWSSLAIIVSLITAGVVVNAFVLHPATAAMLQRCPMP